MIQPKHETEDLLLSTTKNCETLIKQSYRRAEEVLENKLTRSGENFSFNSTLNFGQDSNWLVG